MTPQLEELASLYVLDQLESDERAAFEILMRQTPELIACVREIEARLESHVRSVPQHEPPVGMLERIESCIEPAMPDLARHPATPRLHPTSWTTMTAWSVAATLAVGMLVVAMKKTSPPQTAAGHSTMLVVYFDSDRTTRGEVPVPVHPEDSDARFMQLASLAEEYWTDRDHLSANASPVPSGTLGYALFDPETKQGFIAVRHLPALEPGKRCHLWVVNTDSGEIESAGILPPDCTTGGLYSFTLAPTEHVTSNRVGVFVTAEDGDVSLPNKPHGHVVLGRETI